MSRELTRGRAVNRVRTVLLPPALAVLFAALLCAVALMISGDNPLTALTVMITQVGEGTTAVDIVNSAAVYYLAALAVAIGFQMKLFNIGIEGQYRLAACVAAIVGGAVVLPPVLHTLVILLVGALVGAAWAGIAAVLKAYRGVSEVISTIMLNFVATGLIAFLISTDAFGVLRGNNISTQPIAPSGQVPGIPLGGSGRIFGLILLSAALGVGYWFLLERTRFGFDLKASGESPTAAAAGGVDARRMVIIALLLSGAVAGLVGLPELLGRDLAYTLNSPTGYGFTGIAIALLGRNHPVGIALGALLWAFLDKSALALDNVGVAREIVLIMQGSIVLSVVVAYEIVRRYELAAEQRRVAAQLRARSGEPAAVGSTGGTQ
jgi:general nucleoside transport system permease protein